STPSPGQSSGVDGVPVLHGPAHRVAGGGVRNGHRRPRRRGPPRLPRGGDGRRRCPPWLVRPPWPWLLLAVWRPRRSARSAGWSVSPSVVSAGSRRPRVEFTVRPRTLSLKSSLASAVLSV